jgi:hypothetical protein
VATRTEKTFRYVVAVAFTWTAAFAVVRAEATDFARFLGEPVEIRREPDDAVTEGKSVPGVAIDGAGIEYRLQVTPPDVAFREVGASILLEAMGLPNQPFYPIAHKVRGRGSYVTATIHPVARLAVPPPRLKSGELAESLGQLVAAYVLGMADPETGKPLPQGLQYTGAHFVNLAPGLAFNDFEQSETSLADYLAASQVPLEAMPWEVTRALDAYLWRLETLPEATLDRVLGPAIAAFAAKREAEGKAVPDYRAELRRRIAGVRAELAKYFGEHGLKDMGLELKRGFKERPKAHVNIPRATLTGAPLLSQQNAPVDLLWALYFAPSPAERDRGLQALAEQLEIPKAKVTAKLSELASKSSARIYEVMPHMSPTSAFGAYEEELPQTTLHPNNRETLVVVPVNDEEAREIEFIARRAGAQVLPFHVPHGTRLNKSRVKEIAGEAKWMKAKRVIVVELPPEALKIEKTLAAKGFQLTVVDHHDYKDLNRHHPLSSLEQVAALLGYKLSPVSKAIGVMDRSLIFGLADLGLERGAVHYFARIDPYLLEHEKLQNVTTPHGKLYLSRGFPGKLGDLVAALGEKDYPQIPNVLVTYSEGIRFSGDPAIVARLEEIVQPYVEELGKKEGAHFSGGDSARSMFWGVTHVPAKRLAAITKEISDYFGTDLPKDKPHDRQPSVLLAAAKRSEDGPPPAVVNTDEPTDLERYYGFAPEKKTDCTGGIKKLGKKRRARE